MAMYVTNNTAAMNTSRWLGINTSNMESSLAKLSSGYKINTASDDPAGLVISEKLRAQLDGLSQAVSNNQEASNVVGIAEGAMSEMNDILKKMEELATHAANSGITSADQVVADQAEMDSAVQTIDRIANTTKYSDTYLLNGTQEIKYSANTVVDSSVDNSLLDTKSTNLYQVANTGTTVNISYTGTTDGTTASATSSAKKAYFEATTAVSGADMDGTTITADMGMTITGSLSSKTYSFGSGQTLGAVAETIDADSATTGVSAQLVFDSTVTGVGQTGVAATTTNETHTTGTAVGYGMTKDFAAKSAIEADVTAAATGVVVGKNTDADGAVYLKMTSATEFDIYKDADMTMKVGSGVNGNAITAANSSGLGFTATITNAVSSDVVRLQLGAANEVTTANGGFTATTTTGSAQAASVLSGVRLGENTDASGKIYMKVETDGAGNATVSLYNDSSMSDESLMSQGTEAYANGAATSVSTYAQVSDGGNSTTGLYATINLDDDLVSASATTYYSTISADDLGIRLSSTSYGEDASISVEMTSGALFSTNSGTLIDKSNSASTTGQNATVTVNGQEKTVDSNFKVTVASTDINADLVFDDGELGMTTVAVQGYTEGALASRAGQMASTSNNFATQTINATSEKVEDISGGVQLQTGEGTNYYESSIISIESMTADNLGRTTFTDDFNGDGIKEEKTLSLSDLQSGGYADLSTDTDKAMDIIKAAIDDVSMSRARLGAVQSNMLETNINSLNVAIENITSTESAIRDTDMSTESTNYTKNQILVQAATSMLAQANTLPQQALSLLQG